MGLGARRQLFPRSAAWTEHGGQAQLRGGLLLPGYVTKRLSTVDTPSEGLQFLVRQGFVDPLSPCFWLVHWPGAQHPPKKNVPATFFTLFPCFLCSPTVVGCATSAQGRFCQGPSTSADWPRRSPGTWTHRGTALWRSSTACPPAAPCSRWPRAPVSRP